MVVNTITCRKCGYTVYSRTRHDLRWCPCGTVAIDGGRDYIKITGSYSLFRRGKLEIDATQKELYDDWNKGKDRYGLIEPTIEEERKSL